MNLHPNHYQELHEGSGIAPHVIEARGVFTATKRDELLALGFAEYQALAPAMVLPIRSLNGYDQTYAIKPDRPRLEVKPDGRAKPIKYEYPAGSPNRIDCPPACRADVDNPDVPLLITEGIKKADAAASNGLCCVALAGVWNFVGKHDSPYSALLPDWGHIPLRARKVGIVYDSDAASNPSVRLARERLGYILRGLGAHVYYIDLPASAGGSKQGLDDYLLRNPATSVWELARDPVDDQFAEMQRKIDELQRDLDDLREDYKWNHDLDGVSNKALSPADKLVLRDVRRATRRAGATAYREPQTLYYGERVKHTGQSTSSYGRSLQQLAESGAFEIIEGTYENGKPKVSVVLRENFDKPAQLQRAKLRNSGGARPRNVPVCDDCGPDAGVTEGKTVTTNYTCEGCGQRLGQVTEPKEPVSLVRSGIEPTECVLVEPQQPLDEPTVSNMHPKGIDGGTEPRTPVHCKNEPVTEEPPPLPDGYMESLLSLSTVPTVSNMHRSQPGALEMRPITPPDEPEGLNPQLADLDNCTEPPRCNSQYGECLQQSYCAKQGRCRWAPLAPNAATIGNHRELRQ